MAIPPQAMMALMGGKGGGGGGMPNPMMMAGGALAGAIMGKERGKAWRQQKDVIAAHQAWSPYTRIPLQHLQQEPLQMESIMRGVAMGAAMGKGKSPWGKGGGGGTSAQGNQYATTDETGNPYALNMAAMK